MLTFRSLLVPALAALVLSAVSGWPAWAGTVIEGRAHFVDGDTLDIAGVRIRVHGIDAPERDEVCQRFNGASWACGAWATQEVRRRWQGKRLTCHDLGERTHGRVVARCLHEGRDIAAVLVAEGVVLSCPRYAVQHAHSRGYLDAEKEAAFAGLGLHVGPPTSRGGFCDIPGVPPPVALPARQTAEPATSPAAPACAIKGNVNRAGDRIYHLPGQVNYDDINMDGPGKRWFCTEAEARAAGWRPARR